MGGWKSSTFVSAVQSCKGDNKEGGGVFAGVDKVREGPFSVSITAQTLDESEPGWQALDHRSDSVRVRVTHTCKQSDSSTAFTQSKMYATDKC